MKVQSSIAKPVKQKDGSWKVVVEHFEEEVPFPERKELLCQFCRLTCADYPRCVPDCACLKSYQSAEKKMHEKLNT